MRQLIENVQYKYLLVFGLWAVHGVVELGRVISSSKDQPSTSRLIVITALSLWVALCFTVILLRILRKSRLAHVDVFSIPATRNILWVSAGAGVLAAVSLWVVYGFSSSTPDSLVDDYIRIVLPLLNLASFVSIEAILIVLLTVKNSPPKFDPKFILKLMVVLSILSGFWAIVLSTGLGIDPLRGRDWSRGLPTVPLFEWHILLACFFLIAAISIESNGRVSRYKRVDLLICALVWLGTVLIWNSQLVIPNASALKPHEPNFEIYPFLDAQTYDQNAQSALVGRGFDGIPQRPLYIAFLAISHLMAGQDYESVIRFQTLFLAFFPVFLYLVGAYYFNRSVGISIAILAILRDFTSNLVSPFTGNLSYSKVYLSEIPTAIFLILFLVLGLKWIKEGFPSMASFIMGGVLGIAMLIRTQAAIAFPVIMIFALLAQPKKWVFIIKSSIVVCLGIMIAVSPWLWRNWRVTGQWIFDDPGSQLSNLALRYSRLNGEEPDIMSLPDESLPAYNERLKEMASHAIRSNPINAFRGVASTFLNHAINNILVFPLRYELTNIGEYWLPANPFWETWSGTPTLLQALLLVFYTLLFGLGVAVAWHHNGWLGLLPLGLNLAYNLWTSLALLSGQRFMLTMDWSVYFYYMIGIWALYTGYVSTIKPGYGSTISWFHNKPFAIPTDRKNNHTTVRGYLFAGALFLLIGSLPPLVENAFPVKYPSHTNAEILSKLLTSPSLTGSAVDSACLQKLEDRNFLSFIQGRALYPRYYMAGDGERFTDAIGYRVVDENRLVFEVVGQINGRVILPLLDYPYFFPHASDVTLVYGKDDSPWFVFVESQSQTQFYVSGEFDHSSCK